MPAEVDKAYAATESSDLHRLGAYQGGRYPRIPNKEVAIRRSTDTDQSRHGPLNAGSCLARLISDDALMLAITCWNLQYPGPLSQP